MAAATMGNWSAEQGPAVVGTASRIDTLGRIARLADPGCDIVEIRVDQLMDEGDGWVRWCRELHASDVPLILTLRHESECGRWSGSNAWRLELLQQNHAWINGVDVEIGREAVASAVASLPGITVIGSFHDFEATPSDVDLDALVCRGAEAGAQIVKLASWVEDEATLQRLESLFARHPGVNLAVVGMGPLGPASRIRLPGAGSCLTYGFLDESVAPGQVSASALKQALG